MTYHHHTTALAAPPLGATPLPEILEAGLSFATRGALTEILGIRQCLGLTRYSGQRIHQNVEDWSERIWVRSWVAGGGGWAFTGDLSPNGVAAAVERAEANSRHVDSNKPPTLPEAADPAAVETFFPATARTDAAARTELAARHIARAQGVAISANLRVAVQELALANTAGLRACLPLSYVALNAVARTPDGATWYETAMGRDIAALDLDGCIDRATNGAKSAARALPIPPGNYRIILDPPALSMLLVSLGYVGLNVFSATAARQGNSYILDNVGKPVASSQFSLADEPLNPQSLATPFDAEGTPRRRLPIIERGEAVGVAHDLTTDPEGRSTGHALPASMKGPAPLSLAVSPGSATDADLLASLGDGLIVHRIHPFVSLRGGPQGDLSGTTHDGVLVVRGGEIVGAATNVRWSNRMTEFLGSVEDVSAERTIQWMDLPDHAPHTSLLPRLLCGTFTVHGSQPRE